MLKRLAAVLALSTAAHASPAPFSSPPQATPPGFFACAIVRDDPGCLVAPDSQSAVPDTPALRELLRSVNAAVNDELRGSECADDANNGPDGERNWWTSFKGPGYFRDACANCITYAVTKRRTLLARGLPANAVRFVLVHEYGAGRVNHVLTLVYVRGSSDPYVLDNLGAFGNPDTIWRLSDVLGAYRYTLLAIQDAQGVWQKT